MSSNEIHVAKPERVKIKEIRTSGYLTIDEPDPDLGQSKWRVDALFEVTSATDVRRHADWLLRAADYLESKGQP